MVKIANPMQTMTAQIGGAKLGAVLAVFVAVGFLRALAEVIFLPPDMPAWSRTAVDAVFIVVYYFLPVYAAGKILEITTPVHRYVLLLAAVWIVVGMLSIVASLVWEFFAYFITGGTKIKMAFSERLDAPLGLYLLFFWFVEIPIYYLTLRAFSAQMLKIDKRCAAEMAVFCAAILAVSMAAWVGIVYIYAYVHA